MKVNCNVDDVDPAEKDNVTGSIASYSRSGRSHTKIFGIPGRALASNRNGSVAYILRSCLLLLVN